MKLNKNIFPESIFRNSLLQKLVHSMAGLVLLIRSIVDFLLKPNTYLFGILFFTAGIVIFWIVIFRNKIVVRYPFMDSFFNIIEAFLLGVVAFLYLQEGRYLIQIVLFFTAFNYLVASFVNFKLVSSRSD